MSLPRECILDKLIYALIKRMAVILQHHKEVPRLSCGDNVYATQRKPLIIDERA